MTPLNELPDLASDYELSAQTIADYDRDGHALIRGLATREEVELYYPSIAEALDKNKKENRKLEERGTYHKAFIQVGNLWEIDERVKKYVLARRFAKVAAELMQVDGVRIYHDQALFKEPGGGHTPWHQDQYYWPIDSDKTITMWMPLTDCPSEMGPMIFGSGLHRSGSFGEIAIGDESARFFTEKAKREEWPLRIYELNAGDATFHSGWTPHKAPGNSTNRMRPVMTIIYMAHDVKISQPTNQNQPIDMARFFPGKQPGDLAATHLNPLVYRRGT